MVEQCLGERPEFAYASYFDIDWHPVKEQLQNRILLPMLGDQYGQVLESGELKLEYQEGAFFIRYYHMLLPLDPRTYRVILTHRLDELKKNLPADSEDLLELESIVTALEHLPERTETAPDRVTERQREKEVIKKRLRNLVERSVEIAAFIGQNMQHFNGTPDDPSTFDDLDKLLDMQVYRLSHWKAAADEVNYRRFFDINELAAVCMEDPKVFQESHKLVFDLLVRGDVDALRIDHIDGLYDPMEYLRRLQWGYLRALGHSAYRQLTETPGMRQENTAAADYTEIPQWNDVEPAFLQIILGLIDGATTASEKSSPPSSSDAVACIPDKTDTNGVLRASLPLYVAVEKILGPEEPLPEQWLVAGTTGYDFLNFVNGLFVNWSGLQELVKSYSRYIDETLIFRETAHQSKLLILRTSMSSELQLLAHRLNRISERHRSSRDFTLNTLRIALREIMACFPVYRTYIRENEVSERDRQFIYRAAAQAKRRNPATNAARVRLHSRRTAIAIASGIRRGRPARAGVVRRPFPANDQSGDGKRNRGYGLLSLFPLGID